MTSQKNKIRTLIAEIEAALSSQANPRLPWVMSSETTQQRQVLANTREYLRSLQQVLESPGGWGPINLTTGQIAPPLASTASASPPVTPGDTAEHVLQALLVEMQHLKTNTLQPLRAEIESLRQQREALQTELKQLANQRRPPAAGDVGQQQLNRFLESLMARLQENLSALQPQSPPAVAPAPAHRSTKPTDSPRTSGPNAEYLDDDGLDLLDESVIVEADSDLFSSDLPGSMVGEMDSDEAAEGEDLDALYQKLFEAGANHTLANELMTDRLGLDETEETAAPETNTAAQTGPEEPEAASEIALETDALQARFGPELTMPTAPPEPAAETIESLSELLPYPNQAASAATFGIGDNFESDSEFSNQLDAEPDRASAEVLEKVLALEGLTLDDLVSEARETEVTFEEDRLGFEGLETASSELVEKPSKERLEPTSASAAQASKPRSQGPLAEPRQPDSQAAWFLGLDLGSTGLSAVLMNRTDGQVHPIYWYESSDPATKRFRLPSVAWLTADHQVSAVGTAAWNEASQPQQSAEAAASGFALRQLKPLLKVGVPHKATVAASEEPLIQWTEQRSLPLVAVQSAMEKLLSSLVDPRQYGQPQCDAVGLAAEQLQAVLASLHGVIVGYPINWPDTYSFNLREVLLSVRLVDRPEQIFFVEDAIAAVLSGLPDPQTGAADPGSQSHQSSLYNCNWQGGTAIISAGAAQSEIALVDLPTRLNNLSHAAFKLRSFAYAGNSLDQDIICQLLHPPEANQIMAASLAEAGDAQDWCWRADLPDWTDPDWQNLGLNELTLPQPGESDIANRHRLQRRLESSPLGQSLLEAAHYLKLVLQHQPQCQLDLGNQRWLVRRRELESRIFLPYIQRINRHLNGLLSQQGLSAQAIKQVICTGGSASLAAVARWLRQKFPNATIIQDTYTGSFPNSCSRIAYGLVNLVRYPQLLDIHRHQYSDYFLLTELLRSFPEQPLPFSEMMHLLEQRGINTQVCQLHILALLGGHLPPGLIPSGADQELISRQSQELGLYQSCADAPLFEKDGQIYVPNLEQGQRLRTYLEQILATKNQQLKEPLTAQLASTAGAASGPK